MLLYALLTVASAAQPSEAPTTHAAWAEVVKTAPTAHAAQQAFIDWNKFLQTSPISSSDHSTPKPDANVIRKKYEADLASAPTASAAQEIYIDWMNFEKDNPVSDYMHSRDPSSTPSFKDYDSTVYKKYEAEIDNPATSASDADRLFRGYQDFLKQNPTRSGSNGLNANVVQRKYAEEIANPATSASKAHALHTDWEKFASENPISSFASIPQPTSDSIKAYIHKKYAEEITNSATSASKARALHAAWKRFTSKNPISPYGPSLRTPTDPAFQSSINKKYAEEIDNPATSASEAHALHTDWEESVNENPIIASSSIPQPTSNSIKTYIYKRYLAEVQKLFDTSPTNPKDVVALIEGWQSFVGKNGVPHDVAIFPNSSKVVQLLTKAREELAKQKA